MKRILLMGVLVLIPAIAGCQQGQTYFYHPDKTVEQAKTDCETCHEALLRATIGGSIGYNSDYLEGLNVAGDQCMERMGYSIVRKSQLPPGISTLAIHRDRFDHNVAGK